MLPLILGMAALQGGIGALSGYGAAKDERDKIRQRNQQLDAAKARIEKERSNLRSDTKSLATDFLTNYITVRDPDRAQGIRQSYNQNQAEFKSANAQMESSIANLDSQKQGEGISPSSAGWMGLGIGAAQGAMSGAAAGLGSGESIGDLFSWNGAAKTGLNVTNNSLGQFNNSNPLGSKTEAMGIIKPDMNSLWNNGNEFGQGIFGKNLDLQNYQTADTLDNYNKRKKLNYWNP